jgi:predicted tellurium resistance membrane protein TerC
MNLFYWVSQPAAWVSLATLTFLEIVLGVDNIIFISLIADRLPKEQRGKARSVGLSLALITRILLLLTISWLTRLTAPLFDVLGHPFSGRDLVLLGGGLFLLAKSTGEIHDGLEGEPNKEGRPMRSPRFGLVVFQIVLLDIVFSLDSVITAVGMAQQLEIMILAIIIAMLVMFAASGFVSVFINRHPTIRMLALAFLIMIGVVLCADGLGQHIDRGYVYFAMIFATGVELLNLRIRRRRR